MKAIIKNFQSIRDAVLEFQGFTVITGRSNLGKSALVRALSGACFGLPGDYFIREGTDQCAVGLGFDDLKLKWLKVRAGKAALGRETSLEVNGTKNTKLGKDHATLTEPFGLREIKTQYGRFRPQVAGQHDPIFLLSETEATVAEVFKMLGRVDVVTEAQRLAKKDLKDVESTVKIRLTDLEVAQKELAELSNIPIAAKAWGIERESLEHLESNKAATELELSDLVRFAGLVVHSIPDLPSQGEEPAAIKLIAQLKKLQDLQPVVISVLWEFTSPVGLGELEKLVTLRLVKEEQTLLESERLSLNTELCDVKVEIDKLEDELGVCPLCGKAFDHSHGSTSQESPPWN